MFTKGSVNRKITNRVANNTAVVRRRAGGGEEMFVSGGFGDEGVGEVASTAAAIAGVRR